MNRFEAIEKIFKENGNIDVDGKAIWDSIKNKYCEQANSQVEDSIIINHEFYKVLYQLDIKEVFYKDDKEVEPCDDFDDICTDIKIKSISVLRKDGKSDEHTFVYNF